MALMIVVAGVQVMRKYMARSGTDGELLDVTMSEVASLRFPVGHPRRKVVYVGHPVDPLTYIPVAYFHTFLFEHKVAEAVAKNSLGGPVAIAHVPFRPGRVDRRPAVAHEVDDLREPPGLYPQPPWSIPGT